MAWTQMFHFLWPKQKKNQSNIGPNRVSTGWPRFGGKSDDIAHKNNINRLEKSIKTTSRWHMIWSGALTAVLASAIISVGQPLWEITVIQPLTLSKLKQDFGKHLEDDVEIERRLDLHEKLLTTLTIRVEELIRQIRRLEK